MRAPRNEAPISARQARLRSILHAKKLNYLLIAHMPNVFYLTGFRGSAGMVVLADEPATTCS